MRRIVLWLLSVSVALNCVGSVLQLHGWIVLRRTIDQVNGDFARLEAIRQAQVEAWAHAPAHKCGPIIYPGETCTQGVFMATPSLPQQRL